MAEEQPSSRIPEEFEQEAKRFPANWHWYPKVIARMKRVLGRVLGLPLEDATRRQLLDAEARLERNDPKDQGIVTEEIAGAAKRMSRRAFLKQGAAAAAGVALSAGFSKLLSDELRKPNLMFQGLPKVHAHAFRQRCINSYERLSQALMTRYPEFRAQERALAEDIDSLRQGIREHGWAARAELNAQLPDDGSWMPRSPTATELMKLYKKHLPEFDEKKYTLNLSLKVRWIDRALVEYYGPFSLDEMTVVDKRNLLVELHKVMRGVIQDTGSFYELVMQDRADCDTLSLLFIILGELFNIPLKMLYSPGHAFNLWHYPGQEQFYFETREGKPYMNVNWTGELIYWDPAIHETKMRRYRLGLTYVRSLLIDKQSTNPELHNLVVAKAEEFMRNVKGIQESSTEPVAYNFHYSYILGKGYKPSETENYRQLMGRGYYLRPLDRRGLEGHFLFDVAHALRRDETADYSQVIEPTEKVKQFIKEKSGRYSRSIQLLKESINTYPLNIAAIQNFIYSVILFQEVTGESRFEDDCRAAIERAEALQPTVGNHFRDMSRGLFKH